MKEECGNCIFFKPYRILGEVGICKRYPPVTTIYKRFGTYGVEEDYPITEQPPVHQSDWCGEFGRKG